ncbi:MAG: rhomboid family intramembrane serine protease, partial [Deltaproteobacteria bacterium]|nr:rhomboid family intramembrane serine protease [Deltaproteobacteria bacterium]
SRYLILVILSGLLGSIASYFLGQGALSVGASGAFWGFLGASAALGLRPGVLIPPLMVGHLKRVAIFNLLINLGVSALPNIDMWAHFGGGIVGFVLVISGLLQRGLGPVEQRGGQTEAGQFFPKILAVSLTVLMIASVAMAWKEGKPWEVNQPLELSYRSTARAGFQWLVPEGWEENALPPQPDYAVAMAYGHVFRNAAEFEVQIRKLGPTEFNPLRTEATLAAIQVEMEQGSAPVEWVDSEIPFLRQEWVFGGGVRTKCLRIADGALQVVNLDSLLNPDGEPPELEPETILESIRPLSK